MHLKIDVDNTHNYNGKNWAYQIKQILDQCGLSYLWDNDLINDSYYKTIKTRIMDNFYQTWHSEINQSSRLKSYVIFKTNFSREYYLTIPIQNKFKIAYTRFRTSTHELMIEKGRHLNIPHDNRICNNYNMNAIESEYHFLLVCPKYTTLRRKFLKPWFCNWPNLTKFKLLINNPSKKWITNLSKFIYYAFQTRSQ